MGASHGELSIVGDFDPEATMTQVRTVLGGWKTGSPWERVGRRGDIKLKSKHVKINTPDKANAMYFAVTVFPMKDDAAEYPALLMGNYILGGGALANRLGNRVRQKDGLSYGVRSGLSVGSLDNRTLFYIYAISNPDNVPKVVKAIDEEVKLMLEKGVTEDELAAAKKGYLQSQQVGRGNDGSLASTLASTARTDRTMEHYSGLEQKIRSVTAEQVLEALRKRIDPKRIVLVTAGDFEKKAK
jgi:zinc protease